MDEVGARFQFLTNTRENALVIPSLVFVLGWRSERKLDGSQKTSVVVKFKEAKLTKGGPGAWKKFGCTCSF